MNFKKALLGIFSLVLVVGLTACGNEEKADGKITILALKPEMDEAFQTYVEAYSKEHDVEVEVNTCGGDACTFAEEMDKLVAQGKTPDIFVLEGKGGFDTYSNIVEDLSDEEWGDDTEYAFKDSGNIYGFPMTVEGFGLTYNKDILDAAGIDVETLNSYEGYEAAFKILNDKKEELGIDAPVSMAVGPDMHWVSGLHQFNSYLSSGLDQGDESVINDLLVGKTDSDRLDDYTEWTKLLYENSDQNLLLQSGDAYSDNVKDFTDGKAAFIHQGSWIDGDVVSAGMENVGIAPVGMGKDSKVFVSSASYLFVNKDGNVDLAKQFLNDLHGSDEGQKFLYEDAKLVSPFKSTTIEPTTPLAKSVSEIIKNGSSSPWNQNTMPDGFGMQELGPIHELYARGEINEDEFMEQITARIKGLE